MHSLVRGSVPDKRKRAVRFSPWRLVLLLSVYGYSNLVGTLCRMVRAYPRKSEVNSSMVNPACLMMPVRVPRLRSRAW